MALRNNFKVTKKFPITKFDFTILRRSQNLEQSPDPIRQLSNVKINIETVFKFFAVFPGYFKYLKCTNPWYEQIKKINLTSISSYVSIKIFTLSPPKFWVFPTPLFQFVYTNLWKSLVVLKFYKVNKQQGDFVTFLWPFHTI